ncbi:hypothetical protein [Hymenobacter lapidiphilus]|uniref:Uncharacterized protein n=1 Tax=Hymenobacter lapidiphilus TaxID=2608003 RepID=A0A7Y7PSK3_9BACT|nr:hypothetical protein [Hymenobacter lapidiphilus]NVO33265.1 hypothetical protein [Hymenobacter lapidiphilus]
MQTLLNDPLILRALDSLGKSGVVSIVEAIKTEPVTKFGAVNASGQLAASVRYEVAVSDDSARLTYYAASYALTAVFGRKPGKFPPIERLLQWIDDKPLTIELTRRQDGTARQVRTGPGSSRDRTLLDEKKTVAFLIGRAIAEKGTLLHQAGKPSDLLAGISSDEAIARLTQAVMPGLVRTLTTALMSGER